MTIAIHYEIEQPGRLYNRAPNSFIRRPLQQISSYHNLDDIPTMAALPELKACGGVTTTRASPQTVTDVKTFDAASYQDDAGGVAIDLCLPETDDDEDYFLLQQEEEEELQEYREQPQPQVLSRPTFLPPILEERRVTFAAQHVVMKVNQTDGCSFDQRYVHQVLDSVQVWFIPHHTQYSERQRSNMWYSKAELATMRERAVRSKKRRSSREFAVQQEMDQCVLFAPPPPMTNGYPTKKSLKSERSGSERRARYEAMVDAVLLEQYEQRRMCLRVYGRVEPGFSGILDPQRLAKVYSMAGKTQKSLERAMEKAQKALLEINSTEEDDELSASTRVSGRRALKPTKLQRTGSFSGAALEVETTQCLDRGVGSIFQAMISPWIEIRKGDLFLEVGDEMSVEA